MCGKTHACPLKRPLRAADLAGFQHYQGIVNEVLSLFPTVPEEFLSRLVSPYRDLTRSRGLKDRERYVARAASCHLSTLLRSRDRRHFRLRRGSNEGVRLARRRERGSLAMLSNYSTLKDTTAAKRALVLALIRAGWDGFRGLPDPEFRTHLLNLRALGCMDLAVSASDYAKQAAKCWPRELEDLRTFESRMRENVMQD